MVFSYIASCQFLKASGNKMLSSGMNKTRLTKCSSAVQLFLVHEISLPVLLLLGQRQVRVWPPQLSPHAEGWLGHVLEWPPDQAPTR